MKDTADLASTAPLPLDEGVLPLADCLNTLTGAAYQGWLCWEYEAAWHPTAPPLPPLLADAARLLHRLGA